MSTPRRRRPAVALPIRQQTPGWVDARRDYIGSSDLPIVTGSTPYATSAFSLWAVKTRLAEPEPWDEDTLELFALGHALEPIIADRYTARTGHAVRRARRMLTHPNIPWASANLDRVRAGKGSRRIIEIKWVPRRYWDHDGPEPVPAYVQDQVQWQMFVTGFEVADVAVLSGSRVEVHEVQASAPYQDDLLYLARHFRELIEAGTPPPVDGSEATRQAITRLHPRETLDLMPATAETAALADQLREATEAADAATKERDRLRNVFRLLLGEHAGVEGDGYKVSFRKIADARLVSWPEVAKAYRQVIEALFAAAPLRLDSVDSLDTPELGVVTRGVSLEEFLDALVELHSGTREGARVLRPRFRGEDGKWT